MQHSTRITHDAKCQLISVQILLFAAKLSGEQYQFGIAAIFANFAINISLEAHHAKY